MAAGTWRAGPLQVLLLCRGGERLCARIVAGRVRRLKTNERSRHLMSGATARAVKPYLLMSA